MAKVTPEQAAAEWSQRLAASGEKIRAGVQAVTVPPGQAAARQKETWAANVAAARDKWASRVASVPLSEWQQAMVEKGAPRISQGATAAQGKMAEFMSQLLPHIDRERAALPARGNLDQNIARMTQFVRGMSKFQRR